MSLLDDLKKQAAEKQLKDLEQEKDDTHQNSVRQEKIEQLFDQVEQWLRSFTTALNQIGDELSIDYTIPDVGVMPELKQGNYSVLRGTRGVIPPVQLLFTLYNDKAPTFQIENELQAESLIEELKSSGFEFHSVRRVKNDNGGKTTICTIQPSVPVRIDFLADDRLESVVIRIRNFDHPGVIMHHVNADQITEEFLENLGRYLLHQTTSFMRQNVSLEIRQQLRERIEREAREKERGSGAKKSLGKRLKGLFKREAKLKFTYHGKELVIESSDTPYMVGRAKDCNLKVMAHHVSRHHFLIVFQNGRFILEDSSRNGTYIKPYNGRELLIKNERIGLSGKGFLCPGAPASEDQEHLVHYEVNGQGQGQ
jgi:hypothetical protein